MSLESMLPEITQRILAVSDPDQIILFGSYARGDWGPDSDVDLLVVLDHVGSTRMASVSLRSAWPACPYRHFSGDAGTTRTSSRCHWTDLSYDFDRRENTL